MNDSKISPVEEVSPNDTDEKPDNWWYRVYAAVILTTVLVISSLGMFSAYFR